MPVKGYCGTCLKQRTLEYITQFVSQDNSSKNMKGMPLPTEYFILNRSKDVDVNIESYSTQTLQTVWMIDIILSQGMLSFLRWGL